MITETVLSRSIRLMFAGSLALGMQVATAQDAQVIQKVEVTGSRIPTLNTEGASPVTVLSAKDIKIDGVRNVEDMLNNLPQVFASQGQAYSNGSTGTATVNLRGLGSDRTLVLVDGKRMPAGSVNSTAADLNEIPAALIKRVEVLTGGAGAVYGAGAVAGVVNFILKDNFEGVEVQGNIAGYNHQQHSNIGPIVAARGFNVPGNAKYDGQTKDLNILIGGSFAEGRGNATVFATWKKTDQITEAQRDFTACSLASTATSYACSGSGTQASGRVGTFTNGPNGQVRPYVAATDAYNFGPTNFLQRPSTVYGFNARAHFDVNEYVRVYNEFNFHNYSTQAQVAAGGIFFGLQATLRGDNPLLSPAWKTALGLTTPTSSGTFNIGKRNVEGGPRTDAIEDTSFRDVLGVKGTVNGFTYDVFGQFGKVTHGEEQAGYFSVKRIGFAMDVEPDPVTGLARCRDAGARAAGCVPYNLYQLGGVTQAMLNYLNINGTKQGYTQQSVLGANMGTDLGRWGVKSPFAASGVGISVGVERRAEKLVYIADEAVSGGDMSGAGGAAPSLKGGYSVKEVFGEFSVPLISKKFMAESLDLSTSYRHSDYSAGYKANTYGFGLDWAPIKQVRLRGSYQKAVRAPTIQDLYNPQSIGNNGPAIDPCEGAVPTATAAQCANSGVTAALYGNIPLNSANQHSSQTGGNPAVQPETGKTRTIGLVLNPMKDLTLTIDTFKIDIKDTISSVDPTVALTQCLTTGNSAFCNLIKRDDRGSLWLSPNGPLGFVQAGTANIGSVGTKGIDLGANYRMKLAGMGSLNLTMNGTYMQTSFVENVPGLGQYDCVGYFGATCGTPTPEWRHKVRATWSTPWSFDVSATWRRFGKTQQEGFSSDSQLDARDSNGVVQVNPVEYKMGSRNYLDLNASYAITKKISLSGGINNLFDKDPPIASTNATPAAGAANGNTFPQVYDANGRFIYLNLTARF
ncbi:MAG: TonB-dependent receptor domain-containing protein [Massilia sp.]